MADRYTTIGQSLMALAMPRIASERYLQTGVSQFLAGVSLQEQNTFLYLKPGGSVIAWAARGCRWNCNNWILFRTCKRQSDG